MQKMGIVVSTIHAAIKFQTPFGIGTVFSSYNSKKLTYVGKKVKQSPEEVSKDILSCTDAEERIVRSESPYNLLIGRTAMHKMGIVVSTIHAAIKFQTPFGIGTVFSSYNSKNPTYVGKRVKQSPEEVSEDILSCTDAEERIVVNDLHPDQTVVIGKQLPATFKAKLEKLLRANADVFAWTYSDMIGSP